MWKTMILLLCLLALFHPSFSLECYKCNGCESTTSSQETCRNLDPETQTSACMTQKVRIGGTAEPMTIKKCAIFGKDEKFQCLNLPTGETVYCDVCMTDLCNSTTRNTTNLWISAIILIFTLIKLN